MKLQPSFEEAIEQLDKMISSLESGNLPLEESMKAFEEGMKLVSVCQKQLSKAETKLQLLVRQSEDQWELKEME
ncbi:exodeoxyribonuclease VII small subunit [bacterium]|nr:exodeoxyribonuclease VII small subunit [bacterium]